MKNNPMYKKPGIIIMIIATLTALYNAASFVIELTQLVYYDYLDYSMKLFVKVGDSIVTKGEKGIGILTDSNLIHPEEAISIYSVLSAVISMVFLLLLMFKIAASLKVE